MTVVPAVRRARASPQDVAVQVPGLAPRVKVVQPVTVVHRLSSGFAVQRLPWLKPKESNDAATIAA
jgi:hypothetical protein